MSTFMRRILKFLVVALVPLVLMLGAARVLTTDAFLSFEYNKPGFPADIYGFTPQLRFSLASTNIHYVQAHSPEDELVRQQLNGTPVYNEREVSHMLDVRNVFQIVLRVWQAAFLLLLLLGVAFLKSGERAAFASAVKQGGFVTAGMILTIGLLAVFAWDAWFELFHRFLFVPGTWRFSYTDTLIRLFPIQFWFDATLALSILSFAAGLALALCGRYVQRRSSRIANLAALEP